MYPVSLEYQDKIKENNRTFKAKIRINHSEGELVLTDKDISLGSLIYTEGSQAGEDFTIGGTVASDLSVTILNKPEYENIKFIGARITGTISLLVKEKVDAHFMQPSQPSNVPGFEEKWEHIPLGIFNIDEAPRQRNSIQIKALDNMVNLDRPYSLSKLSYPADLYQIYVNICNVADVQVGTVDFPNKNHVVQNKPGGDLNLRDVLGYVAELSGTFAKFNRNGALELNWYKASGITLDSSNRFDFFPSDDLIQIKGVMATVENTTYLAGTDEYAIDLSDNPLLQGGYETVLPKIYNNIKDTIFTPYTSNWQGNMAMQAGDMITQIDRDGKIYNTLITKSIYQYRGRSTLEAKGLPEISKGFKGSTDKRIAQIKRVVVEEIGDKLTTLEQEQLNMTELIANALGGHLIETEDSIYIANHKELSQATEYWKWGIGGFGHFKDGVFDTGVTAEGSIVAKLVSAGIVTADMVQTGVLTSQDGSTWINLDTGEFNLKNTMSYISGNLEMKGSIQEGKEYGGVKISAKDGIHVNFTEGGDASIGKDSILVNNIDGSRTKIDGRGISRILSIPIYKDVPSQVSLIDNFNDGKIDNSRINFNSSKRWEYEYLYGSVGTWVEKQDNIKNYVSLTSQSYSSSPYSAKIQNIIPHGSKYVNMYVDRYDTIGGVSFPVYLYDTTLTYASHIRYFLERYTPSKNTTFSMKYRYINCPYGSAYLYITDITDSSRSARFNLTSSNWSTINYQMLEGHLYSFAINLIISKTTSFNRESRNTRELDDYRPTSTNSLYIDDIIYEENILGKVLVGYEDGITEYNPFFHIATEPTFNSPGKTVTLPKYFRGMNYEVFVVTNDSRVSVASTDNKVPNVTFSGSGGCTYIVIVQ